MKLADYIRDVPDFPKKGIVFKDITPLLKSSKGFARAVKGLAAAFRKAKVDYVAAVESRGFIFGAAVARKLKAGFIPLRKPGKLPYKTVSETYTLEYGQDTIEVHEDACGKGDRVLIVDDLLATGGTLAAARALIERLGAEVVGAAFVVELDFLKGRERVSGLEIESLIHYGSE
ncbi:MAG TPA: adenine phosphoribosyltransferase [Planctomycetes bacterium]|nr:adenine phosphoribosyltransferase [Planctomycetota bacterium]